MPPQEPWVRKVVASVTERPTYSVSWWMESCRRRPAELRGPSLSERAAERPAVQAVV